MLQCSKWVVYDHISIGRFDESIRGFVDGLSYMMVLKLPIYFKSLYFFFFFVLFCFCFVFLFWGSFKLWHQLSLHFLGFKVFILVNCLPNTFTRRLLLYCRSVLRKTRLIKTSRAQGYLHGWLKEWETLLTWLTHLPVLSQGHCPGKGKYVSGTFNTQFLVNKSSSEILRIQKIPNFINLHKNMYST